MKTKYIREVVNDIIVNNKCDIIDIEHIIEKLYSELVDVKYLEMSSSKMNNYNRLLLKRRK